jgi:hypothetical protein
MKEIKIKLAIFLHTGEIHVKILSALIEKHQIKATANHIDKVHYSKTPSLMA